MTQPTFVARPQYYRQKKSWLKKLKDGIEYLFSQSEKDVLDIPLD